MRLFCDQQTAIYNYLKVNKKAQNIAVTTFKAIKTF